MPSRTSSKNASPWWTGFEKPMQVAYDREIPEAERIIAAYDRLTKEAEG